MSKDWFHPDILWAAERVVKKYEDAIADGNVNNRFFGYGGMCTLCLVAERIARDEAGYDGSGYCDYCVLRGPNEPSSDAHYDYVYMSCYSFEMAESYRALKSVHHDPPKSIIKKRLKALLKRMDDNGIEFVEVEVDE